MDYGKINWREVKNALKFMGRDSGASVQEARGILVGVIATIQAFVSAFAGADKQGADRTVFAEVMKHIPDNFRPECIIYGWIGRDENIKNWSLDWKKITPFDGLLQGLSDSQKINGLREELLDKYLWEISQLESYSNRAAQPEAILMPFNKQGDQYIANFEVKDLSLINDLNRMNFHGQNTSQWVYAGCILVQDGRVSCHH